MPGLLRLAAIAAIAALTIISLAFLAGDRRTTEASHTGGMDALSIDVDVTGNTATSLGPLDSCVEASPGDMVTVDVTASNIPAETAMIAFAYIVQYDEARVWMEAQDQQFLLAANAGSGLFNVSQPTPDQDLNNEWSASVFDLSDWSVIPPEYGNGVLSRLGIRISQGAPDGTYPLTLTSAAHLDVSGGAYLADVLNGAVIAVGASCPSVSQTPTPGPTPLPPPTPTPTPLALSVRFDPDVQLRMADGSVTIHGTVTCAAPAIVDIDAAVEQFVKGETIVAAPPNPVPVACDGQASWNVTMGPEVGRFRPGGGEALVIAYVAGYGGVGASGPVHLKPGAIK